MKNNKSHLEVCFVDENYNKIKNCFMRKSKETTLLFFDKKFDYEYGQLAGHIFKDFYRLLLKSIGVKRYIKNIEIGKLINCKYGNYPPFFLKELEGLSESTKISIDELIILNKVLPNLFVEGCTNILSTKPATENEQSFLMHNFDFRYSEPLIQKPFLYNHIFFWRIFFTKFPILSKRKNSYKYMYWGLPVIYETPFLNEKGLGFGVTSIIRTDNKNRKIDLGDGLSPPILQQITMMKCADIQEAYSLWEKTERSSNDKRNKLINIELMSGNFCDKKGNIASIEYTHNHLKMTNNNPELKNTGILWHTNHHMWLDPDLTGSVKYGENFDGNCSYARAERAFSLLKKYYGNIDLKACKSIARDHGSNNMKKINHVPDGICRHMKKDKWTTLFSFIIQPKDLIVLWTHGNPCKNEFICHNFEDIFKF
jgi:hypothetical protein